MARAGRAAGVPAWLPERSTLLIGQNFLTLVNSPLDTKHTCVHEGRSLLHFRFNRLKNNLFSHPCQLSPRAGLTGTLDKLGRILRDSFVSVDFRD
jgi:hypothetical protein